MAHTINLSLGKKRPVDFCKLEAILIYIANPRSARTKQDSFGNDGSTAVRTTEMVKLL